MPDGRAGGYPSALPHGIMFHHFHGPSHPKGQGSLSADDLEQILRVLGPGRLLSPAEWLDRLASRSLAPHHLCLTFDDTLLSQFDIALPVLDRHGLQAFWFVYSSVCEGQLGKLEVYRTFRMTFGHVDEFYERFFRHVFASSHAEAARAVLVEDEIERMRRGFPFYSANDVKFRFIRDRALGRDAYEAAMDALIVDSGSTLEGLAEGLWMSNEQLRHLSDRGHEIGLHSYSHPTALAQLPLGEQAQEYQRNAAHLEAVCGRRPAAMAHPTNSYTAGTLGVLKRLGIRCGFRSNMVPARAGEGLNPTPLELARQDHANIMAQLARGTVEVT